MRLCVKALHIVLFCVLAGQLVRAQKPSTAEVKPLPILTVEEQRDLFKALVERYAARDESARAEQQLQNKTSAAQSKVNDLTKKCSDGGGQFNFNKDTGYPECIARPLEPVAPAPAKADAPDGKAATP